MKLYTCLVTRDSNGPCSDYVSGAEFLSRKSSASSTSSLDRHQLRAQAATHKKVNTKYCQGLYKPQLSLQTVTLDEKLSGVRAKIALFSSDSTAAPGLGKFQSSEDVAKASGGAGGSSR